MATNRRAGAEKRLEKLLGASDQLSSFPGHSCKRVYIPMVHMAIPFGTYSSTYTCTYHMVPWY